MTGEWPVGSCYEQTLLNRGEQAFESSESGLTSAGRREFVDDIDDFAANVLQRLTSIAFFALQGSTSCAHSGVRRSSGSAHIGDPYRNVAQCPTGARDFRSDPFHLIAIEDPDSATSDARAKPAGQLHFPDSCHAPA
jgi:hypothetical protein